MPWKTIRGVDWQRQSVRWHTVEGPVGGLVSPAGKPVYLYSGGCFWGFYAVGALVEDEPGRPRDVSDGEANFVVRPQPEREFFAPGHCSLLRGPEGQDLLLLHARFGAPEAKRQMCLARLRWADDGLPFAEPV
jgi:GH43 family beta-xylosidase